jgi:hypothetical protein
MGVVCSGEIFIDGVSASDSVRPQVSVLRQRVLLVFEDEVARVVG